MLEWIAILAAGAAAGFVSGLLGVGGGIVMTPVLHYFFGFAWHDAVALSLAVIAVQAPVGIYRHRRKGAVSMRLALPLAAGGLAGVVLGDWLEPRIAVPLLKALFALVMFGAAYRIARGPPEGQRDGPIAAPWLVLAGFGAGIISRLLGVGGGIITVPFLALVGVPVHIAVGSSLVPVWTNAAFATLWNLLADLDWRIGLALAVTAVPGSILGVAAAHRLPARGLGGVVAGAMAVVATMILLTSGAFPWP